MPELKSVSPILDGLMVGQCFSEHDGVQCYPAIRLETGGKYIVKVIHVPSSSVQTEALLLTGAIASREEATQYYMTLADEVVADAKKLNELALLEGFAGCEQVQCEQSEDGEGYEIYLLSPYRDSMDVIFRQEQLTHLDAVNMGLDLCAALAACRRAGLLFIDLKPENVFRMENGSYCIGDVGFIRLKSLAYASIPQKYRSSYTAPEMADYFAQPNETLDIYALGLLLYQAYNGGVLPFAGNAPALNLVPPMYADYELSEIIMKACAPDPKDRWQDPSQMGQALTGYMQRNSVNAIPIVPLPVEEEPEQMELESVEAVEAFLPDMTQDELQAAIAAEESDEEQDEIRIIAALAAENSPTVPHSLIPDEDAASDEETARMLAQAEELMTLVPPEPVVAPEAIHVEIPAPAEEAADAEVPDAEATGEATEEASQAPVPVAPEEAPAPKKKRKWGKIVALLLVLLLLLGAGVGGYHYYLHEYLQYIDAIQISGTDDTAVVTVISDIEEGLLDIVCTDTYGNTHPGKLENGKAAFENLNPQTRYSVSVSISGFHELRGETQAHFTTASRTEISSFQAVVGAADGASIVSFNTSGPEPEGWKLLCTAPGQETVTQSFTGSTVTVTGLTVGCEYTFTLVADGELYLAGETEIKFTAAKVITAIEPVIDACGNGILHVQWAMPEGEAVDFWTVRCYNATGYDVSYTTDALEYTFTGLEHSAATTVEITAAGMTKSVSITVGPNPITVLDFQFTPANGGGLQLSWLYEPLQPQGGWILNWSIDGVSQEAKNCGENAAVFDVYVPGALYDFTLCAADGTQLFGGTYSITMPQAAPFEGFGLTFDSLSCRTFLAPEADGWTWKDVNEDAYTASFPAGEAIYVMISTNTPVAQSDNVVQTHLVIRDAQGAFVQSIASQLVWNSLWDEGRCIMELSAPATEGSYTVSIYIDGMLAASTDVTVVSNPSGPIA